MGKGPEKTLIQRRYTNGQVTHEKMLNITDHQRNANQNHDEIPLHSQQESYNLKKKKEKRKKEI